MDIVKEHITPGIVSYLNVMEDPQQFISDLEGLVHINNLTWMPGTIKDVNESSSADTRITKSIREVEVISLPGYDRIPDLKLQGGVSVDVHNHLNNTVLNAVRDYAAEFGVQAYTTGEGWQLMKYGQGHHFGNHIDDSKSFPRTFSISYYLNDDYEGGEIEFPRFDIKIKPKANQAIIFPANYVYNHVVHPVTSGTRYTIVNWFE